MLNSKGEIDMKKVLSVVLAVMMLALIAVPSFAATVTTAGATDVIVKTYILLKAIRIKKASARIEV